MASWRSVCVLSQVLAFAVGGGCAAEDGDGHGGGTGGMTGMAGAGGMPTATGGQDISTGPWESLAERPCPPDSVVTWENFGASFVLANCTGCHGGGRGAGERQKAPTSVTFDDPASIRPLAERIWLRAADDNATMPPVGAPDAQQRALFGEWLACGAPTQANLDSQD